MSQSPLALPVARHWRDIPQEVKPRALSREGRRRATARGLRVTALTVGLVVAGAAAWQVALVINRPGSPRVAARAELIGDHLEVTSDGVLEHDTAWLKRTLALPADATLDRLDLKQLRNRLLESGQVRSASVVRRYPRTLSVLLAERTPVARLAVVRGDGPRETWLVARDGTVYRGWGYADALVGSLPWLAGVIPHDGHLGPVPGMEAVADLLGAAKTYTSYLLPDWRVISLAALESDGIIEVRTASGQTLRFGTQADDFVHQLARLDYTLSTASHATPPVTLSRIDLSLGNRVPVVVAPPAAPAAPGAPPSVPPAAPAVPSATAAVHFSLHLP